LQRYTTFGASGGIHFGLDLAAPCGTEIVAIADGIVFAVDGPFGSPPHNLMIDHPALGFASLYGHLLEAPLLSPGEVVKQGQVIALVGDQRGDCNRSPHLHLEIRDLKHFRKYNPINFIDADWNRMLLYGSSGRDFMRDLDEPRKWQTLYDQPQVQTGGPIVNEFARMWPPDWRKGTDREEKTGWDVTPTPTLEAPSTPEATATPAPTYPANVQQITDGDCCTSFFWSDDSSEIRFIDRPSPGDAVGVWGVNIAQPDNSPRLVTDRLGVYNADQKLMAYPDTKEGVAVVENLESGQTWEIDTDGSRISFTPDGRLLWTVLDAEVEWRARSAQVWLADPDGSNATILARLDRGSPAAWLSDTALLVAERIPPQQDVLLSTLSLEDGSLKELVQLPRTRGATFSPDRRFMAYLVRFNADSAKNGLWLLDWEDPDLESEPLPFFGSYRWRDERRLVYIPFNPNRSGLVFYEYDVISKKSRPLFPKDGKTLDLTIANNDWTIPPNGSKIALLATVDEQLNGIWVIDIGEVSK